MTRHYCCYFDDRYLPRGVAMIRSLRRFEPDACIWLLCLSERCHEIMTRLAEPGVRLMRLVELETADPEVAQSRSSRSLVEYYFTCTPALVCHILKQVEPGGFVTYVDGDLYFFSNPHRLYEELGSGAVGIIAHRFAPAARHLERFGIYNVGWMTFRNDDRGRATAGWWRERCNEWCYDVLDGDRFADQKYVEQFARRFDGIVVLENPGANLAPWNLGRHRLALDRGTVIVDEREPLVFFHFHGIRELGGALYIAEHLRYGAPFNIFIRRYIYRPYIERLAAIVAETAPLAQRRKGTLARHASRESSMLNRLIGKWRRPIKNAMALLTLQFILVVKGRAF